MYISTEFLDIADDTAENFEAIVLKQTQKDPREMARMWLKTVEWNRNEKQK